MNSERAMNPEDELLELRDGRTVQFRCLGARDGAPVFALHGTPGSRLKFCGAHEAAHAHGVRIIALDRWGYGRTDRPAKPEFEGYGDDLEQLADALGIARFGVMGISGGGPFAAMTAAHLAARVTSLALVSPVGPVLGCPLPGTSLFHQLSFTAVARVPGLSRLLFAAFRQTLRHFPDVAVAAAIARAPPSDRAIMADPYQRQALIETFKAGLEKSSIGPAIDMALFAGRWCPAPAQRVVTRLWIGSSDGNISLPAARHLGALMQADLIELPGCGHYWIARHWPHVLGGLAVHR